MGELTDLALVGFDRAAEVLRAFDRASDGKGKGMLFGGDVRELAGTPLWNQGRLAQRVVHNFLKAASPDAWANWRHRHSGGEMEQALLAARTTVAGNDFSASLRSPLLGNFFDRAIRSIDELDVAELEATSPTKASISSVTTAPT